MIPKECKRLAEVDFPIAVVSRHSAREKSIRHGHPSTLHLWWARRPLAACRAMLMALLLPDPADAACPNQFKDAARKGLLALPGAPSKWSKDLKTDEGLRQGLLKFIGDFANWDVASDPAYLKTSRALVKAAHGDEPPLVVDPFAGGGSIPLEALRIGCDAFASDLNPVACLILKTMLEDIPRHGPGLADELRKAGAEIKEAAERELAEFYPDDPDGAKPIAYLWARTIVCDSCGAEIPLMRSFWLCKKASRKHALKSLVHQHRGKPATIELEVFTPRSDSQVQAGTVTRAKATCLGCQTVLPPERVRAQLVAQRGGADVQFDSKGERTGGARLLAVVALHPTKGGRQYRIPASRDYSAVYKATARLKKVAAEKLPNGLSPIPDEPSPAGGGSGAGRAFSVQKYGMMQFGDLFTARQKLALCVLCSQCRQVATEGDISRPLGLTASRCTEQMSSLVRWRITVEAVAGTFGRPALPMMWDFAEIVPFGDDGSNYLAAVEWVAEVVDALAAVPPRTAQVQVADACKSPLPTGAAQLWFTDPPYYDAIPYSDLSDFFFVWLKRSVTGPLASAFLSASQNELTPKTAEIVQDETRQVDGRPKDRTFFETAMARAFAEGRRVMAEDGAGTVVFAHKTTEGWEALLSGLVAGRWVITSSWPIATERPGRLRSQDSAALATSVHLVCRPRADNAPVADWNDVHRELPSRIGEWMSRLTEQGVRGADLVFACIGPAMEIYSRYERVEDAEGREIQLGGDPTASEPYKRGFLAYVWETVGRIALRQVLGAAESRARNGTAAALEEDARLTALFLWTLQSTTTDTNGTDDEPDDDADADNDDGSNAARGKKKGLSLVYDVARRFAQPLGIHLDFWEGRIIETEKGVVRLLPVAERAKQLFGDDGADAVAGRIEAGVRRDPQMGFDFIFDRIDDAPKVKGRKGKAVKAAATGGTVRDEDLATRQEATTLDRLHAACFSRRPGAPTRCGHS